MLASRLWIPAVVTSLTLGCALEPPVATPEDARALARARERGRDADTEQATVAQERSAYVAEIERKQAELAELDAEFQASLADHRRRADEHESYVAAIASAEAFASACDDSLGPLNALTAGSAIAASSSAYTSEPSRDAALAAMEECRTKLLEQARKLAKQVVADMREEFATEVEDSFDANNPYSRGDLSAKVSGTTLAVKMRGNFEGRARHSQDQVDLWCESGEGLFSKITLKNGHGSFSCTPLESPSQFLAALLDETGGTASGRSRARWRPRAIRAPSPYARQACSRAGTSSSARSPGSRPRTRPSTPAPAMPWSPPIRPARAAPPSSAARPRESTRGASKPSSARLGRLSPGSC